MIMSFIGISGLRLPSSSVCVSSSTTSNDYPNFPSQQCQTHQDASSHNTDNHPSNYSPTICSSIDPRFFHGSRMQRYHSPLLVLLVLLLPRLVCQSSILELNSVNTLAVFSFACSDDDWILVSTHLSSATRIIFCKIRSLLNTDPSSLLTLKSFMIVLWTGTVLRSVQSVQHRATFSALLDHRNPTA